MRTRATDLVGCDIPLFAFSHCRDVVAAVTNAGGCGVLGAVAHTPEQLDIDLAWIEEQVGGKPYGIDLLVPSKYAGADVGGLDLDGLRANLPAEHLSFLDDLLAKHGVPPAETTSTRTLRVDPTSMAPLLDAAFAHTPRLMASALGAPPDHFLARAHDAGIPVAALAGTVDHALRHVAAGADIVVAQGTEAGGHTGQIATMVLVPEVVDAVPGTAVLAAGGIARGRQLAAGMALGADGAWCGSVWLTTAESELTPVVREKFLAAGSGDTVRSRSMTGKPARMIRTAWTEAWEDPGNPDPLPMPLQTLLISPAMERVQQNPQARDLATYFVGQVVGSMNETRSARAVVEDMVGEFVETVERLGGLLTT
jgi:NAD(P)H-dependent flavin oxidoreductase YrpB (nitropropane dioxygenase family)